jgi:hypothetical protein
MESAWLAVLTGISGVAVSLLAILLTSLRAWKKEIREYVNEICKANAEDHKEIWDRINYHKHNGGGSVVIPVRGEH